jgi:cell division septal protein FtsQ
MNKDRETPESFQRSPEADERIARQVAEQAQNVETAQSEPATPCAPTPQASEESILPGRSSSEANAAADLSERSDERCRQGLPDAASEDETDADTVCASDGEEEAADDVGQTYRQSRQRRRLTPSEQQALQLARLQQAQRRQMAFFKARRKQKRFRLIFHRLRQIFQFLLFLALPFALYAFFQADFWRVDTSQFDLSGNRLVTEQNIAKLLKRENGKPLWAIDPGVIAERIQKRYPAVEAAYIRRYLFPTRLEVTLAERQPWAALYGSAQAATPFGLMARDFKAFTTRPYDMSAASLDVERTIRLVVSPELLKHPRLRREDFWKALHTWTVRMAHLPGMKLTGMTIESPYSIVANFQGLNVRLGRMDSSLEERASRIFTLVKRLGEHPGEFDWVDLRWQSQVTVHRTNAQPETVENVPNGAQPAVSSPASVPETQQPPAALPGVIQRAPGTPALPAASPPQETPHAAPAPATTTPPTQQTDPPSTVQPARATADTAVQASTFGLWPFWPLGRGAKQRPRRSVLHLPTE